MMSARTILVATLLGGCGGFDYSGTVGWNPPDIPSIVSISIDGNVTNASGEYVVTPPFVRSYDSFDDAEGEPIAVIVMTTTGSVTLQLVASPCGTSCYAAASSDGSIACSELSSEVDNWHLDSTTMAGSDGLFLDLDYGSCIFPGGQKHWILN